MNAARIGVSLLGALLLWAPPSPALEISDIRSPQPIESRILVLKGEILKGDFERIAAEVRRVPQFIEWVSIDSPGGDVLESMRIGRFLRSLSVRVVAKTCNSACVLVWVGGIERSAAGDLGLHRPFFDKTYFAGLSKSQAAVRYEGLTKQVESYLREMLVPQEAIEIIFRADSASVARVGEQSNLRLYAKLAATSPAFAEWLLSKCGKFPVDPEQLSDVTRGRSALSKAEQEALLERYFPFQHCQRRAKRDAFAEGLERVLRSTK